MNLRIHPKLKTKILNRAADLAISRVRSLADIVVVADFLVFWNI